MSGDLKKEEKKFSILGMAESEMADAMVQNFLPKIKPFLAPMMEELNQYLGDEDKTVVIRRRKNSSPVIVILDNKEDFIVTGPKVDAEKKAILKVYNIEQFVELLINGKLTETLSKM
jgi:hypothetical protein